MIGRDGVVSIVLWVVVVAVYLHGAMGCSDSRWSIPTAVSFLDQGNFDLDEFAPVLDARGPAFLEHVGNHWYTVYPFGASVVAAPAVAILRPIARIAIRLRPSLLDALERTQEERGCPTVAAEPVIRFHSWTEQIVASWIVALTAVVVYYIARTELSRVGAVFIATLFAFGTPAWSMASRSLWQHGPSMLMLALALLVQVRRLPLILMGLALGFAYAVRPTNIVPLVLWTMCVVATERRNIVQYVAGLLLTLGPFFVNNYHVYGTWLSPYYHPAYFGTNPFVWDGLRGILFSPGRGLFVYSPFIVFCVVGIALKVRRHTFSSLDMVVVACIVLHTGATAWANAIWWGGFSYGPRLSTDLFPYFMYLVIPVMAWIVRAAGMIRALMAAGLALASLASVFIHAQGALNPMATLWNVNPDDINTNPIRLWDWRNPPFLAGLRTSEPPPVQENITLACSAAPGAPTDFRMVSDRFNMLVGTWTPPQGPVTGYIVESGTAPGLHEFPDRDAQSPTLTAYRVPPGTYYARVRAKNQCGVSKPSNEIVVIVR